MAFRIFFVAVACVLLHTTDAFSNLPRTSKAFQSSPKILYSDLSAESGSGGIPALFSLANKLTSSKFYSGIETVIVIGLLSAVDGGFSGDWSRLGYITTETEAAVRSAITIVGLFHLVCTPIAVLSAARNKQPVVPAALHTLLIGGLGLGKVLFQNEDQLIDFPNIKQGFANAVAGKYDELAVSQSIDDVIDGNAVVMFSFTSCPYCIKAKQLLIDDLGVNVKVVELDTDRKVGFPIRAELGKRTGRVTVPSIWIGGQFVGGCNDGPRSVTLPAVKAVSKGFSIFGFGDKTEAVEASVQRDVVTKGGLLSLNNEGLLQNLLLSAKAI